MTRANSSDDVTGWMDALQAGEPDAAQRLWEVYYSQLVNLARRRLGNVPRRAFDEDDVAQSVFQTLCARASERAFPQLHDREDLWALLITITARKVAERKRHAMRKKRGEGKLRGESALAGGEGKEDRAGWGQIVGREPTPEFAAQVAEQVERLMTRLEDPSLQQIAQAKMEGYSQVEIAQQTGLSERTVRRKLKVIATIWEDGP